MRGHLCTWGEQCPLFGEWFRTMRRRVRVYDNKDADYTVDRYTVLISRQRKGQRIVDIYYMSENAGSPQGVNQYSHTANSFAEVTFTDGEKRVQVQDLPQDVIKAIEHRL